MSRFNKDIYRMLSDLNGFNDVGNLNDFNNFLHRRSDRPGTSENKRGGDWPKEILVN